MGPTEGSRAFEGRLRAPCQGCMLPPPAPSLTSPPLPLLFVCSTSSTSRPITTRHCAPHLPSSPVLPGLCSSSRSPEADATAPAQKASYTVPPPPPLSEAPTSRGAWRGRRQRTKTLRQGRHPTAFQGLPGPRPELLASVSIYRASIFFFIRIFRLGRPLVSLGSRLVSYISDNLPPSPKLNLLVAGLFVIAKVELPTCFRWVMMADAHSCAISTAYDSHEAKPRHQK